MLVLRRKTGDSLILRWPGGQAVEVAIVAVADGRASVGVQAPVEVNIVRKEVDDGIYRKPGER